MEAAKVLASCHAQPLFVLQRHYLDRYILFVHAAVTRRLAATRCHFPPISHLCA